VNWARKLSAREAEAITVDKVLSGSDGWNPMSSFAEGVAR
jgi:hypothetical protein